VTRQAVFVAAIACAFAGAPGCSLLLDWNDFSGGGDSGAGDSSTDTTGTSDGHPGADSPLDGVADGPPATCSGNGQCVAAAPSGWTGPVELFVAPSGTPPSCGAGFDATPAFDGNGGLTAAAPTCTACGCGGPTGASCSGPFMSFYVDDSCGTPSIDQQEVTAQCEPTVPIAASVQVGEPVLTAGSCAPTGGTPSIPAVVWSQVARACTPVSTAPSGTCDSGQICTASPVGGFTASACVLQPGVATSCPSGYPTGPQVFYSGVDDERACSACTCGAPTGAACSIGIPAVSNCVDGTTLDAGPDCSAFTGGDLVKLGSPVTLNAGSCAVSGGGAPGGVATGTGGTSFCCSP
jgi:hypothetical protein